LGRAIAVCDAEEVEGVNFTKNLRKLFAHYPHLYYDAHEGLSEIKMAKKKAHKKK
jgi:hypothetical protein